MDDFPPICKQDPLDVRVMFMKEYFETTGKVIKISDIPDEMYGGALPIAKNRKSLKRKMTEAEYLEDASEPVAKAAKTSVPISSDVFPQQEDSEEEDSVPLIRKRKRVEQMDSEQVIIVESRQLHPYPQTQQILMKPFKPSLTISTDIHKRLIPFQLRLTPFLFR